MTCHSTTNKTLHSLCLFNKQSDFFTVHSDKCFFSVPQNVLFIFKVRIVPIRKNSLLASLWPNFNQSVFCGYVCFLASIFEYLVHKSQCCIVTIYTNKHRIFKYDYDFFFNLLDSNFFLVCVVECLLNRTIAATLQLNVLWGPTVFCSCWNYWRLTSRRTLL